MKQCRYYALVSIHWTFQQQTLVCVGLTLRYLSSAPFSMYSVTIIACLTAFTKAKQNIMLFNWFKHVMKKYVGGGKDILKLKTHRNPYIWWPLLPNEWYSGGRTGPWWRLHSENPVSAFLCSQASVSLWPPSLLSCPAPSEYHGTPLQIHLQKGGKKTPLDPYQVTECCQVNRGEWRRRVCPRVPVCEEVCSGCVLRDRALCSLIGEWPVVWEHGNQLSHEDKEGNGGGSRSWELGRRVSFKG